MSQSLRILLIADDPDIIRRVGQGLQRQDSGLIMLEGAESLATARRRLNGGAYDLALVDLALGQHDGLHLLSELREMARDLPVVALAGGNDPPDMDACLALGAQDRLALESLDAAGLFDRLQCATARARAGQNYLRRNARIAASLGASGDLAWHFEAGENTVWLAAADPVAWQLAAGECWESLEALRGRIHPDDRELALRRLEELLLAPEPWQVEARFKADGGAYRWFAVRGRAEHDAQGRLLRASGTVLDVQQQQRQMRELRLGRRFLRAVFDSSRIPQAVLDSSSVISECNEAWLGLDHPSCYAGKAFAPGRKFTAPPEASDDFGDLDGEKLRRGVKQVLGGVAEQFTTEYGAGGRFWRIGIVPLRNPGIAGAIVSHEDVTESCVARLSAAQRLAGLEADFGALVLPILHLGPEFTIDAVNAAAATAFPAAVAGMDVSKALPRAHADAVSDALVALAGDEPAVTRDVPLDGRLTRWLAGIRRDGEGRKLGFLLLALDVSDLAPPEQGADDELQQELAGLQEALQKAEAERARLAALVAELESGANELRERVAELSGAADSAQGDADLAREALEESRRAVETLRLELDEARRRQAKSADEARRLGETLEAERGRSGEILAALSAAEQQPLQLRAELERARSEFEQELRGMVTRLFGPLAAVPAERSADDKKGSED